jgi:hypothetical protein
MMKKKIKKDKYFAGGLGFPTKSSLISYCKGILNSGLELEGEDYLVIDDVLRMHPRYKEKIGKGSYLIFISECSTNPINNAFYIEHSNGHIEDFSFYKAINKYNPETRIKNCFRKLIDFDHKLARSLALKKNKATKGKVFCDETGLKISPSEAHLDHYPLQFEEIVGLWFEKEGLKVSDILFEPSGELSNKTYCQSFIEFHKDKVQYRLVMNKVNLQRGKANIKLPK